MADKKFDRSQILKKKGPADDQRSLLQKFGLAQHYLPDEFAPPVDREMLNRYLRQELSPDELKEVCRLIASYRCWHEACATLLRDGAGS